MRTLGDTVLAVAILLLLFVASAVGALPTRNGVHSAKVTVEVVYERDPETALRKHLPKHGSSVTVKKQRNTGLFEIWVAADSAEEASRRANEIAMAVKAAFDSEGPDDAFVIRELAEPPPKRPLPK